MIVDLLCHSTIDIYYLLLIKLPQAFHCCSHFFVVTSISRNWCEKFLRGRKVLGWSVKSAKQKSFLHTSVTDELAALGKQLTVLMILI
jgi:hypothetical protein